MIRRILYISILISWLMPWSVSAYTTEDCLECHSEGSEGSVLHISVEEFRDSVHGSELTCTDCHTGIVNEEHELNKEAGAVDCGACHDQENRHGLSARKEDRPQCYTCHGSHYILPIGDRASAVYRDRLKITCRGCHPVECGETGFLELLPSIRVRSHKKQDFSKAYDRYNCIGCHQGSAAHGEEGALTGEDCGICHMDVKGHGTVLGYFHPGPDSGKKPVFLYAGIVSYAFIAMLLWGIYRFLAGKRSKKSGKRGK